MNDLSVLLPGFWAFLPAVWAIGCALVADPEDGTPLQWVIAGLFPLLCAGAARLFP